MPTELSVITDDDHAYQWLTLCIQAFEEAALESGTRAGYLAVANGTTYSSEVILDAQERSLKRVDSARRALNTSSSSTNEDRLGALESIPESNTSSSGVSLVDEDADLLELFGNDQSAFANYLEDCIGCSLRLKFDWQLKPLNLLGPIDNFLNLLDVALDNLKSNLDPFRILEDICWALNHLKTLCPQDLIMILLALKGLLKRYLLNMFNIKLDWTVLLGPILQALISAITDLLDNIVNLLLAPLDCVVAGLNAANDLERAGRNFALAIQGAGTQVDNFFSNIESEGLDNTLINQEKSGFLFKDATWAEGSPLSSNSNGSMGVGLNPGSLQVNSKIEPMQPGVQLGAPAEDSLRIPAGFVLTNSMTLDEALQHPNFAESTWIEKILLPVREALNWFRTTYEKYINALESLGQLTSGSIGFSMNNIGALLFILDMIALIKMIYKLLKSNIGVNDWCSELQKRPQLLEEVFSMTRGGTPISVEAIGENENAELLIRRGPVIVGTVNTCANSRSSVQNTMIENWVKEIEARGTI